MPFPSHETLESKFKKIPKINPKICVTYSGGKKYVGRPISIGKNNQKYVIYHLLHCTEEQRGGGWPVLSKTLGGKYKSEEKKNKKKVAGLTCTLFSTKVKSRLHLHSKYVYLRLFEAPWHYDPRGSEAQVQLGGFTGEEDRENTGKINEKKTFPDIPVQLVQRGPRHWLTFLSRLIPPQSLGLGHSPAVIPSLRQLSTSPGSVCGHENRRERGITCPAALRRSIHRPWEVRFETGSNRIAWGSSLAYFRALFALREAPAPLFWLRARGFRSLARWGSVVL